MKNVVQDTLAYILLLLARILSPKAGEALSRAATRLSGDVPDLNGWWTISFRWPHADGGTKNAEIDAKVRQFGRFFRASGHLHGEPGDPFEYRGTIRRNVLYGTFQRKDSHILAGTGTFIVKVNADNREMEGSCAWYASKLDAVWRSPCLWNYRGGSGGF